MKKFLIIVFILFLSESVAALEGGPSQPDYARFVPSGIQDMVDLQSGDFTYQIPLSDIRSPYGNYPLSLSYHAAISPQQEASWVGLGWTLNPGVITRNVRGVPDDQFHGGTLGFIYQYSAKQSFVLETGYSIGVFSGGQSFSSDGSVGFSATVGPKFAGIAGVGFSISSESVGLIAGVGYSAASLNVSLGLSTANAKPNASIGAKLGVGGASIGAQISTGQGVSATVGFGSATGGVGLTVSSSGVSASAISGNMMSANSRAGMGVSVNASQINGSTSQSKGKSKMSSAGFGVIIPTQIGIFSFGFNQAINEYWLRSATSEYVYGYIYQAGPAIDVSRENDLVGLPDAEITSSAVKGSSIPWKWTMKGRTLESMGREDMSPAYDMYSVASEGVSGSFRPFARESQQLYKKISNQKTNDNKTIESYITILKDDSSSNWPYLDEFELDDAGKPIKETRYNDYAYCMANSDSCSIYGLYKTNFLNNGNRLVFNSNVDEFEERGGMHFLFVGEGSGYYESENVDGSQNRLRQKVSDKLFYRSVNNFEHALYGSRKIEPLFEDDSPTGNLAGFVITSADGSRYYFRQPIRSYLKVDYSINKERGVPIFSDKSTSRFENFWKNFLESLKSMGKWSFQKMLPQYALSDVYDFFFKEGKLDENCKVDSSSADYFYSYIVNMNPYATQWLLTEIQGADFVRLDSTDITKNIGYNVKFNYSSPSIYRWRSPYARPGLTAAEMPNSRSPRNSLTPQGCDSRAYNASFGVKEYVYLESIETATDSVSFVLNDAERADGKGWDVSDSAMFPILIQTTIAYSIDSVYEDSLNALDATDSCQSTSVSSQTFSLAPKYLYFNSKLPDELLESIYQIDSIHVYGLMRNEVVNCLSFPMLKKGQISPFGFDVVPTKFRVKKNSFQKTTSEDAAYGRYRLELEGSPRNATVYLYADSIKSIIENKKKGSVIALGENGDFFQSPYIDWSELIFAKPTGDNKFNNQMRYLKKISYYAKGSSNAYREYDFNYDYSLQPKTLNSYCTGYYPDSTSEIIDSPDSADVNICESDEKKKALYGKLTLKSISEKGCQNNRCATLPPFKFYYNSPSATSTRISTKDGWLDYFQGNLGEDSLQEMYDSVYFDGFTDLDATILATSNTIDEYGFWSNSANIENHKVDQSFADYGASAWSLNKVVDPAGGNLEIEYERDSYSLGEDYSQDKKTVEFVDFRKCSEYHVSDEDSSKLCVEIKPLYWREQCLGPRASFWDTIRPAGYEGNGFEYIDTLGIKIGNTLFFNLTNQLKTKIKCGLFGIGRCTRTRSVALVGSGKSKKWINMFNDTSRVLVLNRLWDDVIVGLQKAANKINDDQSWTVCDDDARNGYLWTSEKYEHDFKAGDLRVSKLTRHDVDLKSQTVYEYDDGEIAQLADSAYTTVLGSRFYTNKISYAIPDIQLMPQSRIVGFSDDDITFIPSAKITYPKVTVKNSAEGTSTNNGSTEFFFITPESGIPADFVDEKTKLLLRPFLRLNILGASYNDDHDYNNGRIYRISLLDSNKNIINSAGNRKIIVFPEERTAVTFYSDEISLVKYIQLEVLNKSKPESYTAYSSDAIDSMSDFNDMTIAIYAAKKNIDGAPSIHTIWARHQKKGFFPILYKAVSYNPVIIDLKSAASEKYEIDSISVDFEKDVTYHDLTAFLGNNYKVVFRRGYGDKSIVIKSDSSLFSTAVPEMNSTLLEGVNRDSSNKIGRQVEKWTSKLELQCTNDNKGNNDICKKQHMSLYMRLSDSATSLKNYTHIRYPIFQIGSITYTGHDNQDTSLNANKLGITEIRNHGFDPLTGSPTASVAISNLGNGKELRKITKKIPSYIVQDENSNAAPIADSMFLRNMLTQNYMEEIYFDTTFSTDLWNSILTDDFSNLQSFTISPYRFVPDSLYETTVKKLPIVAWGTYGNKVKPTQIRRDAFKYLDAEKETPSLYEYSGANIRAIDKHFKGLEVEHEWNRSTVNIPSGDGMYQMGVFFPATVKEVAIVQPYASKIFTTSNCFINGSKYSIENGVVEATGSMTINCSVGANSSVLIEYRNWNSKTGWKTVRNVDSLTNSIEVSKSITLSLNAGEKLNYLRIYPESAEAKTFIYDMYGNMTQMVSEQNTSIYYEYDPLGKLVQMRDDDGISFKSHHREYINGTSEQWVYGE